MKKIIVIAAAMLCSLGINAQSDKGTVTFTPKLGVNIASMTEDDGCDPRLGFVAGGELGYQVSDRINLTGGLIYSQQGICLSEGGADFTMKLDYINVPIMLNAYVAKGLAIKVGLQPGFNVKDAVKVSADGFSAEVDLSEGWSMTGNTANYKVNSFDLAIPVGLSYDAGNFVIDARYNASVTKALESDYGSAKNQVFQITLGYKFEL